MTTAIATSVIVALWDAEDTLHRVARSALDRNSSLFGTFQRLSAQTRNGILSYNG